MDSAQSDVAEGYKVYDAPATGPHRPGMHRWHFAQLGAEFRLPDAVLAELRRLAGEALPNETGGTLIGYYGDGGRVAQVERALGVRRGARQGRSHFYRPSDAVDGQLAEIYRASGGRTYYLGEWHSHPGSAPGPSGTDLHTMHDLARSPMVATDTPVLLILEGDVGALPTLRCLVVEATGRAIHGSYLGVGRPTLGRSKGDENVAADEQSPNEEGSGGGK